MDEVGPYFLTVYIFVSTLTRHNKLLGNELFNGKLNTIMNRWHSARDSVN